MTNAARMRGINANYRIIGLSAIDCVIYQEERLTHLGFRWEALTTHRSVPA
jgi:hypothetical protein